MPFRSAWPSPTARGTQPKYFYCTTAKRLISSGSGSGSVCGRRRWQAAALNATAAKRQTERTGANRGDPGRGGGPTSGWRGGGYGELPTGQLKNKTTTQRGQRGGAQRTAGGQHALNINLTFCICRQQQQIYICIYVYIYISRESERGGDNVSSFCPAPSPAVAVFCICVCRL